MINGDCTNSLFVVRFTNINNNIYKNLFPDQFQSNSQITELYGDLDIIHLSFVFGANLVCFLFLCAGAVARLELTVVIFSRRKPKTP